MRLILANRCGWQTTRLSDVCTVRSEVVPEQEVQTSVVQLLDRISFDEGKVFAGGHTDTKMTQYRAKPGDIVVSKINARKKAIGIVASGRDVGITIHFRALIPDGVKIDTQFLWLALRSSFCTNQFDVETGGIGKGEISEERLLSVQVPLPPLATQRAIVARWQAAQAEIAATDERVHQLEETISENALADIGITLKPLEKKPKAFALSFQDTERFGVEFNRWAWTLEDLLSSTKFVARKLSEVAYINPPNNVGFHPEDLVSFVPMEAVSDKSGEVANPQVKPYREVKSGYTRFANGDVIWAKITPCMQNGKCAIASNLQNGIGFGSTEFHVVRVKNLGELLPAYIWVLLRLKHIRLAAQRYFIGSAGQQRVPADFLEDLHIPIPPLAIQREIVARVQAGRAEIARERQAAQRKAQQAQAEIEALILGTQQL